MDAVKKIDAKTATTFALITIGLIGMVILGVAWSKNRANQLAGTPPDQTQQQDTPQIAEPQTTAQPSTETATTPASGPHIVPAAGATDTLLLLASVMVATFMGLRFVQTYRYSRAYR